MADVSAIGALLGILKTARDAFRALRQEKLSVEHRAAVENALDQLADAQDRLSEIQAESINLRDENDRLKRQIADTDGWTERYQLCETEGGAQVYKSIDSDSSHFACPVCIEKERQIQVLQDLRVVSGHSACPACGAKYRVNPSKQVRTNLRRSQWVRY